MRASSRQRLHTQNDRHNCISTHILAYVQSDTLNYTLASLISTFSLWVHHQLQQLRLQVIDLKYQARTAKYSAIGTFQDNLVVSANCYFEYVMLSARFWTLMAPEKIQRLCNQGISVLLSSILGLSFSDKLRLRSAYLDSDTGVCKFIKLQGQS